MSAKNSDAILARMMALHPKVIDLTLDRMWRLLDRLGNPQNNLPQVIHIAGTNGKGSTQAMIRAGLEGMGKRVQAYTSPHLARFHERIRLADGLISEPALSALLDECYAANGDENITYFEITTAAALLAFSRDPADYLLLEVGLGGRLDATNVVADPALTIITPVDLDHQQFLGETLGAIAGEKAGILKRGVPAIIAPQQDEALDVIEAKIAKLGVPAQIHGQQYHCTRERDRVVFQDETGLVDVPLPALQGPHQVQNAGTVIAALRCLGFGDDAAEAAMKNAEWPARMQRLSAGPLAAMTPAAELWLDGGHNPAAGQAIADTLSQAGARPTHLICGMINTKDVAGFLRPIARHAQSLTAITIPDEANAVPAADIAAAAGVAGFKTVDIAPDLETALRQAPKGRVLICGSLYLAGHALRLNTD